MAKNSSGTIISLLIGLASGETAVALRRAKTAAIAFTIAGALALIGLLFLLLAGYLLAAAHFGLIEAALGFGAAFILLALIALAAYKVSGRSRRQREALARQNELATVAAATGLALLPAIAARGAGLGLLVAPILGYVGYRIYRENTGDGDTGSVEDND